MNQIIKKHWRYLAFAILFTAISSLAAVYLQFIKGDVLDFALAKNSPAALRSGILLLLLIVVENSFWYFFDIAASKFFLSCVRTLRERYFSALIARSFPQFQAKPQGEYVAAYTDQINQIQKQYFENVLWIFEIGIKALFVAIGVFLLDWRIALVTLFLLTTPLYVPKLVEKRLQRSKKESAQAFERHLAKLLDWLKAFELIKNFGVEEKIKAKFRQSANQQYEIDYRMQIVSYQAWLVSACLSYFSHFIILAFAAGLVLRGEFSAGQFFVAVGMIDQLSMPILALSVYFQEFTAVKPVREKLEVFLNTTVSQSATRLLEPGQALKVRFDKVNFAYESKNLLLKDFNLEAARPERLLITGPNGSGKSTAMNLLLNYHLPQSGTVSIADVPVSEIGNLPELVTVLRQDTSFFQDTVRENLRVYQELPDDRLIDALKKVGLEKWANSAGLNLMLESGAANLSGGERRRLALARALIRDTPVMILDEPLANLDKDSHRQIEDLILGIKDKLLFLISHQFAPEKIDQFDQIIRFG